MSDATLSGTARAEVRSVLAIAEHFVRLKERALQFLEEFSANQRGHFTPTEDEQSRQLLVSYWQSRNALLELVSAYQACLLYTSPSPRDQRGSRMPSSA